MTEDAGTSRSVGSLASRLEFETLISELSTKFIDLPSATVDGAIESALRRVCEFLAIDYAVLWQESSAAGRDLLPTHAYPVTKGLRLPAPLGQEQYPWIVRQVRAGRTIVTASLDDLPPEAAGDRESARLAGIKSNLTVPLVVGGRSPIGALAFNTLQAQREWPDAVVTRLQLVAQVFANALARKRSDEALRESEERLALAADSAEAGLWMLDYKTGVFWATERARAIFGYAPDEVVDLERFTASVHPDDRDLVRETIARSAHSGAPVRVDYRILTDGGGERWITSRGRPQFTSAGEPDRLMGISIDITERRSAEDALRASEARLTSGAELAGLGFYDVDFSAGSMHADDLLCDLCGVPTDRREGLQVLEFWMEHLHADDRDRVLEMRRRLHEGDLQRFSLEYRYLHPARGERWLHHLAGVAERDADKRTVRSYGALRDITERKRVEDELRDLSRRLIRAHEEERALLARELHDDVSQRLAVLAIDVGRAEMAAPDAAHAEAMQTVREGLVRLSEDVHALAYQLHPSVLEELGLAEALRAECERRNRTGQLAVSVDLGPLPAVVTKDEALCLFRVAQEALNNAARHSGARLASVTLAQADGGLLLGVSDDGVGFDPVNPEKSGRLGLASMRERVRLVAGTLDIESAPGQGTTVVAWVPLNGEWR